MLFIDNNVCQHLSQRCAGTRKLNGKTMARISALSHDCFLQDVVVYPYFGLTELCVNRVTGEVDRAKYLSFGESVRSTLERNSVKVAEPSQEPEDFMEEYKGLHNLLYVHLLKIKTIEHNGLGKQQALRNISEYVNWSEEMECHSGYPSQVAYALFGGEPKARKVIKVERERIHCRQYGVRLGICCTFSLCRMLSLLMLQTSMPSSQQTMRRCPSSAPACSFGGAFFDGKKVHTSFGGITFDFPHFRDHIEELHELHSDVKLKQIPRLAKRRDVSRREEERLLAEKMKLEAMVQELYTR